MLSVVPPEAFVEYLVGCIVEGALAIHLSLKERAHIIEIIHESQSALSFAETVLPIASVNTPITEGLSTKTMANIDKL